MSNLDCRVHGGEGSVLEKECVALALSSILNSDKLQIKFRLSTQQAHLWYLVLRGKWLQVFAQ